MKAILGSEKKAALLKEFKALNILQEKLVFWNEKLGELYIKYLFFSEQKGLKADMADYWRSLEEFRIIPKKTEYEEYSQIILVDFELFEAIKSKKTVLRLSQLIETFEKDASLYMKGKEEYVSKKIEEVKSEVERLSKVVDSENDNSGEFFRSAFEKVYYQSAQIDFSERFYADLRNLIAVHNGSTYASYLEYLEVELVRAERKGKKKQRELTLRQQLLILDYFGITGKLTHPDTIKKAEFLSLLIDKNIQNVREQLTYYHRLKSPKITEDKNKSREDLNIVLQLFEEQGLKSLAKQVKADLQKLDQ